MNKIHVWNSRTLENITILSGIHRKGVHLLCFSKSDKYLVSCGLNKPSAVVIYDWKKEVVLVSTSIPSPTQDIFIFPDLYIDERIKEEEEKEFIEEAKLMAIEEGEHEGDEEDQQVAIMGSQKPILNKEQIVILSKNEITVFDLTANSLNSHSINMVDSDVKSEVI